MDAKTLRLLMGLMHCKPFRGKLGGPEDRLALEVAGFLRAATLEGKLIATWSHIPHEIGGAGIAAKVRMALAKAIGLIAGSADYVFVWPGGGGWLELKSETGSLTPAQRNFREWCVATGCHWEVCRSLDEVRDALISWGALRP